MTADRKDRYILKSGETGGEKEMRHMDYRNRNHKVFGTLLAVLCVAMLFISCQMNPVAPPPEKEISPHISGKVVLPQSSGLKPESIGITVRTSDGAQVAQSQAETDGSFHFEGLDKDVRYSFLFSSEETGMPASASRAVRSSGGFGGWLGNLVPSTAEGASIGNVRMRPLGTIEGKVTLKGVTGSYFDTTVYIPGTSYMAMTDETGAFHIYNVPQGFHDLRITHQGYDAAMLEKVGLNNDSYSEHPVTDIGELVLSRNLGSISGRVRLPGTSNFSGTLVYIEGEGATDRDKDISIEDGSYSIGNVKPGSYNVVFSHEGHSTIKVAVTVRADEETIVPEQFMKSARGSLRGTFKLEGKETHEGITILLKSTSDTPDVHKTTSLDGNFTINDIVPGTYQLIASRDGYESVIIRDIDIASSAQKVLDAVQMKLSRRSVIGKVTLEGATDYSGIEITATSLSNSDEIHTALTNRNGDFSLMGMPAGKYLINVSNAGYQSQLLDIVEFKGNDIFKLDPVELRIVTGSIRGRVLLDGRSDASGVKVELLGTAYSMVTDESGSFVFDVPPATYSYGIRFSHDYYETREYGIGENMTVLENEIYPIAEDVTLAALYADARGTASIVNANPTSSDPVTVTLISDSKETSVTADEYGSYFFKKVPVGEYDLRISYSRIPDDITHITVSAGNPFMIPPRVIEPDTGNFYGKAVASHPNCKEPIIVEAYDADGALIAQTTASETGAFILKDIPKTGTYDVKIHSPHLSEEWIHGVKAPAPLENKLITEKDIVLADKVNPVVSYISFKDVGSTLSGPDVNVRIEYDELGSGVAAIRYNWNLEPVKTIVPDPAAASVTVSTVVPDLVDGNTYTFKVEIEDLAGNISWKESSIKYCNDVSPQNMNGVLDDANLHWTAADSPYHIVENVTVPAGKTLVIDPGVQVNVGYMKSIKVEGSIVAVGTETEPIVFKADDSTTYTADAMVRCSYIRTEIDSNTRDYVSGNRFAYCNFSGYSCVSGNFHMDHCNLDGAFALGFDNEANESTWSLLVRNSRISGNFSYGSGLYAYNNTCMVYDSDFDAGTSRCDLDITNADFIGNRVNGYDVRLDSGSGSDSHVVNRVHLIESNEFNRCALRLNMSSAYVRYNEFRALRETMNITGDGALNFCNFINNDISELIWTGSSDEPKDLRYNYWGPSYTDKLDKGNQDFISGKALTDGHVSAPHDTSKTPSSFMYFDLECKNHAKVGEPVIAYPTTGSVPIVEYRYAETIEDLMTASWNAFDTFMELRPDASSAPDGNVTIYVEGMTADDQRTPMAALTVPYGTPVVRAFELNTAQFDYFGPIVKAFHVFSPYEKEMERERVKYYIDGTEAPWADTTALDNGTHTIRGEYTDIMGNVVSSEELSFSLEVNHVNTATMDALPNSDGNYRIRGTAHIRTGRIILRRGEDIVFEDIRPYFDMHALSKDYIIEIPWQCFPERSATYTMEFISYDDEVVGRCDLQTSDMPEHPDTAPQITFKPSPANPGGGNYEIIISDERGIDEYTVRIDGKEHAHMKRTWFSDQPTTSYNLYLDERYFTAGSHEITVEAFNYARSRGTGTQPVEISKNSPTVTIAKDPVGRDEYRWLVNYTDEAFIRSCTLFMDGLPFWTAVPYSNTHSIVDYWHTDPLPGGDHEIRALIICSDESQKWSNVITENFGPAASYRESWKTDGSLSADASTEILFNFDNQEYPFLDETRGWNHDAGSMKVVPGGTGGGCLTGVMDEDNLVLAGTGTLGAWTLEMVAKGDVDISIDGIGTFTGGNHYGFTPVTSTSKGYGAMNGDVLNGWHHVAYVFDGTRILYFVDGVYQDKTEAEQLSGKPADRITFEIDDSFIDSFRFSSKARSAEEIFGYVKYLKDNGKIQ